MNTSNTLSKKSQNLNSFVRVAAECGSRYLSCGGPTSRLEDRLQRAGSHLGFETDVFATPAGVFVSAVLGDGSQVVTKLVRVKHMKTNLSELAQMDLFLENLATGQMSPEKALSAMKKSRNSPSEYRFPLILFGAFVIGCVTSFSRYFDWPSALLSGFLCLLILWMNRASARLQVMQIFFDFAGCFLLLILAGLLSQLLHRPPEAFAIGALIIVVPGLTLTTAISELAEYNFVSGLVKMMKGFLTLLAMGTAYVLSQDVGKMLFFAKDVTYLQSPGLSPFNSIWVEVLGHALLIAGFSIVFQVPRKALAGAIFTGLVCWVVLNQFKDPSSFVLAAFSASFAVGISSLIFGRFSQIPSQIFSVPGILSLVPGMLALSAFQSFARGTAYSETEIASHVALIGCAIVFGLFSARVPFIVGIKEGSTAVL